MSVSLLGVNHKTAPVEVRERLAIADSNLAEATRSLVKHPGVREGLILSTCNRVEFLTAQDGVADLLPFVEDFFSIRAETLEPHLYRYRETDAMRHLFRVASSLDSMVVGEPQILGQVRQSYSVAREVGAMGGELDPLLRRTLAVAKRVRTETRIGASSVSIASVAAELAKKIFGSLRGKTVCLVGTGKMGELAARHLLAQGAQHLLVTNRTLGSAERVAAKCGGEVFPFESMFDRLDVADIIITTTGSPQPIFRQEHGQKLLQKRRNRPIFFIDIAVPRDVDAGMNKLDGVFVYDIDDLQQVAAGHRGQRESEAARAEQLIEREVERFRQRAGALETASAIANMQRSIEQLRAAELLRNAARLSSLSEEQRTVVDLLTRGLVKKILHGPMTALRSAAEEGDAAAMEAIEHALSEGWTRGTTHGREGED